jgi:dTDP-4-amino-4,6-dideoxygalactose transaminase
MQDLPALFGGSPVRTEFLHFARPKLSDSEIESVVETLKSGWLTTAGRAKEFEESFKKYTGSDNAIALNSCTAGLFLALKALGIGPGDEVITTPLTFVATVNVIEHVGAKPVLVDIDPVSWCIDPGQVEKHVTSRTKAIMPVHLYGHPCNMDALRAIADAHGIAIVQDCAHAIETEWDGTNVGKLGDLACYSFYATKNVTTGEGGMVTTDDTAVADRLRVLALHGLDKSAYNRFEAGGRVQYDVHEPGYKYNMPDILAALGVEGLKLAEDRHARREEIWKRYVDELEELPGLTPPPECESRHRHARHLFSCAIDPEIAGLNRDGMLKGLAAENIGSGLHYMPVHYFDFYKTKYKLNASDLPNTSLIGSRIFSLPLTPFLSDEDVGDVIRAVNRIIKHHSHRGG